LGLNLYLAIFAAACIIVLCARPSKRYLFESFGATLTIEKYRKNIFGTLSGKLNYVGNLFGYFGVISWGISEYNFFLAVGTSLASYLIPLWRHAVGTSLASCRRYLFGVMPSVPLWRHISNSCFICFFSFIGESLKAVKFWWHIPYLQISAATNVFLTIWNIY
jgi:hypothetical protein